MNSGRPDGSRQHWTPQPLGTGPQMTKSLRQTCTCLAMIIVAFGSSVQAGEDDFQSLRNTSRTRIVAQALKSSVNIHTEKRQKSLDVVFSAGRSSKINGMGTGIVIDERGYIVTNYHVVQDVERLRITTYDGNEYDARVLAYDSRQDLAIIKIEPREKMTVATMGSSSDLMLGEDVIAIGNAYGYESTVTMGIISHKSRNVEVSAEQPYENLIQIDAAINPGNSGGPLLNADGEVIGINVAIRAGAQRIGFAIPIDAARKTIARLINIERHHQTFHGIRAIDFKNGRDRKLIVQSTQKDSPADKAGIEDGDVIIKSGETVIVDGADLERSLFGKAPGEKIEIVVQRNDEQETLTLEIAALSRSQIRPGRQRVPSLSVSTKTLVTSRVADKSWRFLGVKLGKIPNEISLAGQPYTGGLQVTDVRSNGPAFIKGIRKGDILVGLHIWETTSDENIDYVLNHPQLRTIGPLKFYIVRNGETLFGHFPLLVSQR